MVVEAALPALPVVTVAAAIDSINPCAIGVKILLVSMIIATGRRKELLKLGLVYIAAVYLTYFAAGLGLMYGLAQIPIFVAQYISILVGMLVVFGGLVEIKDFFWYGRGFSLAIPADKAAQIHEYAQNLSIPGLAFLGAFVAGVELPCTGGPYLAITLLLSQTIATDPATFAQAFLLLAYYNLIFVLPLVAILVLVMFGMRVSTLKKWKQATRHYMRLGIGMLLIALGWILILIANFTITLE
jgi:cytochrome c biogenesis protein CcdA